MKIILIIIAFTYSCNGSILEMDNSSCQIIGNVIEADRKKIVDLFDRKKPRESVVKLEKVSDTLVYAKVDIDDLNGISYLCEKQEQKWTIIQKSSFKKLNKFEVYGKIKEKDLEAIINLLKEENLSDRIWIIDRLSDNSIKVSYHVRISNEEGRGRYLKLVKKNNRWVISEDVIWET